MSDIQREAFEVWCHNNPLKTDRRPNGDYKYTSTDLAWQAWQAAIASVVVNLGCPSNFTGCASDDFYWRNIVERAIEEAGASYK